MIIIVIVFIAVGYFYWFQLRPAQIKHECSWTKRHSDAVPGITQEQRDKCEADRAEQAKTGTAWIDSLNNLDYCDIPRPVVPAKDWWGPANGSEYNFCLHEKGL